MRGHLEHRGGDRWRLTIGTGWDEQKKRYGRRRLTFRGTEAEAQAELERLVSGEDPTPTRMSEVFDLWLAGLKVGRRTKADYERVVEKYLRPKFGHRPPNRIRLDDLEDFYDSLPVGPARVARINTVMRLALRLALRKGWTVNNVAEHVELPSITPPDIILPPDGALAAMLKKADTEMGVFIRLGRHTGARCGELCALRWTDLDEKKQTLRFARATEETKGYFGVKETKTGNVRTIAIDAPTVRLLKAHKARSKKAALTWGVRWREDSYVFRTWPDDTPWRANWASQRFSALRDELGYEGFTVHSLRHLMATTLLAEGVDVAVIAHRGGWANPSTFLRIYAHHQPARDRAAAEVMGRVLG